MSLGTWLLNKTLSSSIKRLIVLSSFAAHIRDLNKPDDETLEKLNQIMALSSDAKAMLFPMKLHSRIWSRFDHQKLEEIGFAFNDPHAITTENISNSQIRILIKQVINSLPQWLVYQSHEEMRKDFYHLLTTLDVLKPVQIRPA